MSVLDDRVVAGPSDDEDDGDAVMVFVSIHGPGVTNCGANWQAQVDPDANLPTDYEVAASLVRAVRAAAVMYGAGVSLALEDALRAGARVGSKT